MKQTDEIEKKKMEDEKLSQNQKTTNEQIIQQSKEPLIFNNRWILKKQLSAGSFGIVFLGEDKTNQQEVAIKLQKEDSEDYNSLQREVGILNRLQGIPQVPKLYWSGREKSFHLMVIQLLGKDLASYMKNYKKFSLKTIILIGVQMIEILKMVHEKSIIHRDIKPQNIIMGRNRDMNNAYLVDFGISKLYRDNQKRHIIFRDDKPFIGTTRYASISAHLGHQLSRKDDLQSLFYVLIFLYKGSLKWQHNFNVADQDQTKAVGEIQNKMTAQQLIGDLPIQFGIVYTTIRSYTFKDEPDYDLLVTLLKKAATSRGIELQDNHLDWTDKQILSSNTLPMEHDNGNNNAKQKSLITMGSGNYSLDGVKNQNFLTIPNEKQNQNPSISSRGSICIDPDLSLAMQLTPSVNEYEPSIQDHQIQSSSDLFEGAEYKKNNQPKGKTEEDDSDENQSDDDDDDDDDDQDDDDDDDEDYEEEDQEELHGKSSNSKDIRVDTQMRLSNKGSSKESQSENGSKGKKNLQNLTTNKNVTVASLADEGESQSNNLQQLSNIQYFLPYYSLCPLLIINYTLYQRKNNRKKNTS